MKHIQRNQHDSDFVVKKQTHFHAHVFTRQAKSFLDFCAQRSITNGGEPQRKTIKQPHRKQKELCNAHQKRRQGQTDGQQYQPNKVGCDVRFDMYRTAIQNNVRFYGFKMLPYSSLPSALSRISNARFSSGSFFSAHTMRPT